MLGHLRKAFSLGLGVMSVSRDRVEKYAIQLVKEGVLTAQQAEAFAYEILDVPLKPGLHLPL